MGRKPIQHPTARIRRAYDLDERALQELLGLSSRLEVSCTAALNWLLLSIAPRISLGLKTTITVSSTGHITIKPHD